MAKSFNDASSNVWSALGDATTQVGAPSGAGGSATENALARASSSVYAPPPLEGNKGRWLGRTAEQIVGGDGIVYTVHFMLVEAIEDTWLSVATRELGWDAWFSQDQGFGAYERSIVIPEARVGDHHNFDLVGNRIDFEPDRIEPGERFLIRLPPEAPKSVFTPEDFEPAVIVGELDPVVEVKTYFGASVGLGVFGGMVFSMAIRRHEGQSESRYVFTQIGGGLGVGVTRPTAWTPLRLTPANPLKPSNLEVDPSQLEGNGTVVSINLGPVSGAAWEFSEPNVKVIVEGWDLNVGVTTPIIGYWHRV